MADLTQNVTVNLSGSGNLAAALANAKSEAKDLSKSMEAALTGKGWQAQQVGKQIRVDALKSQAAKVQAEHEKLYESFGGAFGGKSFALMQRQRNDQIEAFREQTRQAEKALHAEREAERQKLTRTMAAIAAAGGGLIASTVGLYNPWAVERFHKAMRDLGATVGRDLVPWLDRATRIVRAAADAWAKMPGPVREVVAGVIAIGTIAAIGGLAIRGLSFGLKSVAETAGIVTRFLFGQSQANRTVAATSQQAAAGTALQARGNVAAGASGAAGGVAAAGMGAAGRGAMAARLGVYGLLAWGAYEAYKAATRGPITGDGSSYGMAVGQPRLGGIESYLDELQLDAMKASGKDQKETNNLLKEILTALSSGQSASLLEGLGVNKNIAKGIGTLMNPFAAPAIWGYEFLRDQF